MTQSLPRLIDCKGIQEELGVKRATAEQLMRYCETKLKVGRRVYVYRADVLAVMKKLEIKDRPVRAA